MNVDFYQGVPVTSGTIRGRARLVRDFKEGISVDRGAVLIIRFPVPKISPMLKQASALLCAFGSTDSFLAKAAREQGIPSVFHLGHLLDTVKDGEWILVDGNKGRVICERS